MTGFTVVIPLYNKERHIRRTLQSVLNQSYRDFEVLVIDDGSTDRSGDVAEDIHDSRFKVIHQENAGVSRTRNRGVELAQHDIIAFLDADDQWQPDYLQRMAQLCRKYPQAALYASNYQVQEPSGTTFCLDYPGIAPGDALLANYFVSAFHATPLWTSAVCVRKKVFADMGGFPTDFCNGEDLDLWCRIALRHPIAYANEPLAIYRRDSDNMLSRSLTDPCWFPFLVNYTPSPEDLIQDVDSIRKYIVHRQLEAASASLFVLKDRQKCREILRGIQGWRFENKKHIALSFLSFLPVGLANTIYWHRHRK